MFRQILLYTFCNIHESSSLWSLVGFYTIYCRKAPNRWTFLHPSLLTAKNRVKAAFSISSTCFVIVWKLHQAKVHFCIQFKWFQLTYNQCSAVQHWQVCSLRNRQISTPLLTIPHVYLSTGKPSSKERVPWMQICICQQRESRTVHIKYVNLLFQHTKLNCNFS